MVIALSRNVSLMGQHALQELHGGRPNQVETRPLAFQWTLIHVLVLLGVLLSMMILVVAVVGVLTMAAIGTTQLRRRRRVVHQVRLGLTVGVLAARHARPRVLYLIKHMRHDLQLDPDP